MLGQKAGARAAALPLFSLTWFHRPFYKGLLTFCEENRDFQECERIKKYKD